MMADQDSPHLYKSYPRSSVLLYNMTTDVHFMLGGLGLMLFRVFVIFKKVACVHCMAKKRCPNAIAMGLA